MFGVSTPIDAYADVRLADVVYGSSVEERGLSVAQCPSIEANYVIVVDDQGTVYFDRDAETETQIASITKIMTAIVALENAPLDTDIIVSEDAASIGESTAALQEGDKMTLDQALTGMMVSSGNDAALAIAETLGVQWASSGQTPVQAFAQKMNETAQKLGMSQSLFENPHGLDFDEFEGNLHSSARDVSIMAAYAMQIDTFKQIVAQSTATITVERNGKKEELELESTDKMLDEYDGACGIKTGFTALAGESFAGACERDGEMLYAIVLDSNSEMQRFYDCEELFNWVYKHRVDYQLVHSGAISTMTVGNEEVTVPVVARVSHKGWLDKTVPGTFADYDESIRVFDLNGNISQEVSYKDITEDVHAGDVLGTIRFKQHNEVIATRDIIATEDVYAPNVIEGIGIWFTRVMAQFTGEKTEAKSVLLNETPLLIDKSTL